MVIIIIVRRVVYLKVIFVRVLVDVLWLLFFWIVFILLLVVLFFCGWSIVFGVFIGYFVCLVRDSFKEIKVWVCEGSIGRVWKNGKMLFDDMSYFDKIVNKVGCKSYV